jgi:hypothetical protein
LSLDGALYKAPMTAGLVQFIEKRAYNSAIRDNCLAEERDIKKIAMTELFDMISGSETGAIIAASLVIPNLDPITNGT